MGVKSQLHLTRIPSSSRITLLWRPLPRETFSSSSTGMPSYFLSKHSFPIQSTGIIHLRYAFEQCRPTFTQKYEGCWLILSRISNGGCRTWILCIWDSSLPSQVRLLLGEVLLLLNALQPPSCSLRSVLSLSRYGSVYSSRRPRGLRARSVPRSNNLKPGIYKEVYMH